MFYNAYGWNGGAVQHKNVLHIAFPCEGTCGPPPSVLAASVLTSLSSMPLRRLAIDFMVRALSIDMMSHRGWLAGFEMRSNPGRLFLSPVALVGTYIHTYMHAYIQAFRAARVRHQLKYVSSRECQGRKCEAEGAQRKRETKRTSDTFERLVRRAKVLA